MDWRDLNNRAAWGHQPLEALSGGEPCNWPGIGVAGANLRECFEMLQDQIQIEFRPKRQKPSFVNMHPGFEEAAFEAMQYHTRIGKLVQSNSDPAAIDIA